MIDGCPVKYYPFEQLALWQGSLDRAFNKDERYDLFKIVPLTWLPNVGFGKNVARESVGAAIRICKAINEEELADRFNKIVEGCFVPDESQKELGLIKKKFFLVEMLKTF